MRQELKSKEHAPPGGRWSSTQTDWTGQTISRLSPPAPLLPPLLSVDNLNATFRYKIWAKAAHKSSGKITRGCSYCNGSGGRCPWRRRGETAIRSGEPRCKLILQRIRMCPVRLIIVIFSAAPFFPLFYDTLRGAGRAGERGKLLPQSSLSSFVALVDVIWHFPDIFII